MEDEQQRIRENISVLGQTSQENVLREKYVKKLTDQENKFEKISSEIKTMDKELESLNENISKKMDKLRVS